MRYQHKFLTRDDRIMRFLAVSICNFKLSALLFGFLGSRNAARDSCLSRITHIGTLAPITHAPHQKINHPTTTCGRISGTYCPFAGRSTSE